MLHSSPQVSLEGAIWAVNNFYRKYTNQKEGYDDTKISKELIQEKTET